MNPFIETAAEALVQYETSGMCHPGKACEMCDCGVQNMDRAELAEDARRNQDRAQHVLASLVQHRDDIARVLGAHQPTGFGHIYCSCARWPYDESDDQTLEGHARHQVDAVLAALGVTR